MPKKAGERLTNYHLAVGNLDASGREEIVFSNAKGSGVWLDVFRLTDEGELSRVAQYSDPEYAGYTVGSWVKIANVDTSTEAEEIVTASFKGGAQVDLWNLDESSVNLVVTYLEISAIEGYNKGLHIAPAEGGVWISTHGPKAKAVWASRFAKKQVMKVKNNGDLVYRLPVQSKGSFLDLIDLE